MSGKWCIVWRVEVKIVCADGGFDWDAGNLLKTCKSWNYSSANRGVLLEGAAFLSPDYKHSASGETFL
jgi:hypothetical protein